LKTLYYPDAHIMSLMQAAEGERTFKMLMMTSTQSSEKIVDFYTDKTGGKTEVVKQFDGDQTRIVFDDGAVMVKQGTGSNAPTTIVVTLGDESLQGPTPPTPPTPPPPQ